MRGGQVEEKVEVIRRRINAIRGKGKGVFVKYDVARDDDTMGG